VRHALTTGSACSAGGSVIDSCMDQHRHEEYLKFLRTIDREVPNSLAVHMIQDNYPIHKHPAVKAWMADHSQGLTLRLDRHRRIHPDQGPPRPCCPQPNS